MKYFYYYLIIGLIFVVFDFVFTPRSREIFLKHPFMAFFQILRWPLAIVNRIKNFSNESNVGFKGKNLSKYQKLVNKELLRADLKEELDLDSIYATILYIACTFEIKKDKEIISSRLEKVNEDLIQFEAFCCLFALLEKHMQRNFPKECDAWSSSIRNNFIKSSIDVLPINKEEVSQIINLRFDEYKKMTTENTPANQIVEQMVMQMLWIIEKDTIAPQLQKGVSLLVESVFLNAQAIIWSSFAIEQSTDVLKKFKANKNGFLQNKSFNSPFEIYLVRILLICAVDSDQEIFNKNILKIKKIFHHFVKREIAESAFVDAVWDEFDKIKLNKGELITEILTNDTNLLNEQEKEIIYKSILTLGSSLSSENSKDASMSYAKKIFEVYKLKEEKWNDLTDQGLFLAMNLKLLEFDDN